MDNNHRTQPIYCPYLGTFTDSEVHFRFATPANCCYRTGSPDSLDLSYQEEYCLSAKHLTCPIYQPGWDGALPEEMHSSGEAVDQKSGLPFGTWQLVWIVLGIIAILILMYLNPFKTTQDLSANLPVAPSLTSTSASPEETLEPSPTNTVSPTSTPRPTNTATLSPTPSLTLSPTVSPTPTPGPLQGTPFITNRTYLIHEIIPGESLFYVADLYNTSPEVIQVINASRLITVFPPGEMLVILPNQVDASGLEPLDLVFLKADLLISEFISQYNITEDEFREYNGLGPGDIVPADRWVIFPQR